MEGFQVRFWSRLGNMPAGSAYRIIVTLGAISSICIASATDLTRVDVCQTINFNPSCPVGSVIRIESATYGRTPSATCASGNGECWADVKNYVERTCAGRRSCLMTVPDTTLENSQHGCDKNLVNHLSVTYECQPVYSTSDRCEADKRLRIASESDVLSSDYTEQTSKGSSMCPWQIETQAGRTIVLTLIDYSKPAVTPGSRSSSSNSGGLCRNYVKVTDGSSALALSLCGGEERSKVIMRSTSNVLQVTLQPVTDYPFLIQFQVTGCVDYVVGSPGAHVDRSGDNVTVRCSESNEVWQAECRDGAWVPHRNCSAVGSAVSGPQVTTAAGLGQGHVILLVAGVALFISISIIVLGIVILRCRPHRRRVLAVQVVQALDQYDNYGVPFYADAASNDLYPMLAGHNHFNSDSERDYATTLQMRNFNRPYGGPYHPQYPPYPPPADVSTCPMHGTATNNNVERNGGYDPGFQRQTSHTQHIYEMMPELDEEEVFDEAGDRGNPAPFYHELDPRALERQAAQRKLQAAAAASGAAPAGIATAGIAATGAGTAAAPGNAAAAAAVTPSNAAPGNAAAATPGNATPGNATPCADAPGNVAAYAPAARAITESGAPGAPTAAVADVSIDSTNSNGNALSGTE